jgi:hypothetical protein
MLFTKIASALLTAATLAFTSSTALAAPTSSPAAGGASEQNVLDKREFCFQYNTQDCRDFELYEVKSTEIQNYIRIGNASNIDSRVPAMYRGVFYMMGNPLPGE